MRQVLFHIPFTNIPVYGFGAMLFLGFVSAAWVAARRAKREGIPSKRVEDAALWILLGGVVGARIFFVVQYHELFVRDGVLATLWNIVNLTGGGLVWYGGVIGAVAAFAVFVRRTRLPALALCDLFAAPVMLGLAFGRIGCLLNGCCYGSPTTLPWAVHFPAGSIPCKGQLQPGHVDTAGLCGMALHPTQLYAAINALLLFAVLSYFYPLRKRNGAVIGLLMLLYPPTRFLLELLRNDEEGQAGSGLTISQIVSILAFIAGLIWMLWLRSRPTIGTQQSTAAAQHASRKPGAVSSHGG